MGGHLHRISQLLCRGMQLGLDTRTVCSKIYHLHCAASTVHSSCITDLSASVWTGFWIYSPPIPRSMTRLQLDCLKNFLVKSGTQRVDYKHAAADNGWRIYQTSICTIPSIQCDTE